MTSPESAMQALELAAKGQPHCGKALAAALELARKGELVEDEPSIPDLALLSEREHEVAVLIATEGLTNKQIAARLDIAVKTVRNHLSNVMAKLDIHSRSALVGIVGGAK